MVIYNNLHISRQRESEFYYNVFSKLDLKIDHDIVLISKIHTYNGPEAIDHWPEVQKKLTKPTIVFCCSDEWYTTGDEYLTDNVTMVFKQYSYYIDHPRIKPIPLPTLSQCKYDHTVKMKNRFFDYSFAGIYNESGRHLLVEGFEGRRDDNRMKYLNLFRPGFNQSLTTDQYSSLLSNSKIALCPPGFRNNECYRTIEAARCGCIIVSEPLNIHWYFHDKAVYHRVDSWDKLDVIDEILSLPEKELQNISDRTRNWYEEYLSPSAVARYVSSEVNDVL